MANRALTPDRPHSDAATTLLALSQTPPQVPGIGRHLSRTPEDNAHHSSALSTPHSDHVGVAKVSNSEDEDLGEEVLTGHFESTMSEYVVPPAADALPVKSTGPTVSTNNLWKTFTGNFTQARQPDGMSSHGSSFNIDEDERFKASSPARQPFTPTSHVGASGNEQMSSNAGQRSPLPSLIPPDMVDMLLGPVSSFVTSGSPYEPGAVTAVRQQAIQPLYEGETRQQPPTGPNTVPRQMPHTQRNTQISHEGQDHAMEDTDPAHGLSARSISMPSAHMGTAPRPRFVSSREATSRPGSSNDSNAQSKALLYQAQRKHAATPPRNRAAKRARDGFGSRDIDITDFKYRTIKAIQMPARNNLIPGQGPPVPSPDDLIYGIEIDYQSSMLVYWLDEEELTYSETARRYRAMFSGTTDTDDTIRKKHIVALTRLARKYGLKPEDELEEPSKNAARRGQHAGCKYNAVGGKAVYAAGAGPDRAGAIRQRKFNEPAKDRGFLQACICVWKDTSNVSFELIQQRLASEYDWHLGVNTVQKIYYEKRNRVYDRYDKTGKDRREEPGTEEIAETAVGELARAAAVDAEVSASIATQASG